MFLNFRLPNKEASMLHQSKEHLADLKTKNISNCARNMCRAYSLWISESSEFCKGQASESPTTRNQENENSENSNEGYFPWLQTGDDDIFCRSIFELRVGPLEVYLQNLKSLRSLRQLRNLPFFSERYPNEYVFDAYEVYEKRKRQKNVPKEYTLSAQLWCHFRT